jgi:hypothetical protein
LLSSIEGGVLNPVKRLVVQKFEGGFLNPVKRLVVQQLRRGLFESLQETVCPAVLKEASGISCE